MTEESDSLTGQLNQVGAAAAPSSGSARPGYGGVLDDIVHGTGEPTGPAALSQLLNPAKNPTAPSGPPAPPLEVDPDVLREVIQVYSNEINGLKQTLIRCNDVMQVKAPGNESASKRYATEHQAPAASLYQSVSAHLQQLTDRRDALQSVLDSYLRTESSNAHHLRSDGK